MDGLVFHTPATAHRLVCVAVAVVLLGVAYRAVEPVPGELVRSLARVSLALVTVGVAIGLLIAAAVVAS